MICHSKKFIFIDICKCATTSIQKAFNQKVKCKGKHHSITNIVGHRFYSTQLSDEEIENYYKFTIVRNPYDRLTSLWHFCCTAPVRGSDISFEEFVTTVYGKFKKHGLHDIKEYRKSKTIRDIPHANYLPDDEFSTVTPMINWLKDKSGEIHIDFIGRYENLSKDINFVTNKLEMGNISLPRLLPSSTHSPIPRRKYTEYYNKETKKMATEMYEEDLDFFKYKF